jgi:hypothetical protein
MKRTYWKCTGAFTPVSYRVAVIAGMILIAGIGFVLAYFMGLASALMVGPMVMTVIILIDYLAFSGISTRREKCMEIMKSSVYGKEIIDKALKTDIVIKLATMLLCFSGCLIGCIVTGAGVMFVLVVMLTAMVFTELALIFTRRKGLSIAMQTMIIYFMVTLLEGAMVALLYAVLAAAEKETAGTEPVTIVVWLITVGMAALTVIMGIVLHRDCVKGYESGFFDNSETGAEK